MPINQPHTPAFGSRQIGSKGTPTFPIPSGVQTLPPLVGIVAQVGAYFQTTLSVGIPSLASNGMTVVSANVQLTTFPAPLVVPTGSTALIISSVTFFNAAALEGIILGLPGVTFLNNGFPQSTLLMPGSYNAPALQFTIPVHAPTTAFGGGIAQLAVWAILFASVT